MVIELGILIVGGVVLASGSIFAWVDRWFQHKTITKMHIRPYKQRITHREFEL